MDLVVPPKLYLLPYNPTAENMARYLLDEICPKLLKGQTVTCWKIVLWETDDAFAEAIRQSPST
jgi:6-pyruvoyltetrahydropterin/6-carboxytetrahydropterin synthase